MTDSAIWMGQRFDQREHARDGVGFACANLRAAEEPRRTAYNAAEAGRGRTRMACTAWRRAAERHSFQKQNAFNGALGAAEQMLEARAAASEIEAQDGAEQPTQNAQRRSDVRFDAACSDDGLSVDACAAEFMAARKL